MLQQNLLLLRDTQDVSDLRFGKHTGQGIRCIRSQQGAMGEYSDTYPEEFFQVGLINHQELETLKKRNVQIGSFQQDTPVEGKPAQLPVDVYAFRTGIFTFLLFVRH